MTDHVEISLADQAKQLGVLRSAERYFESLVLFALLESGVLAVLARGAATHGAIEQALDADERALRATLDAAVALGILGLEDARYSASEELLDALVRPSSPASIAPFVSFLHALVGPLSRLGSAIRPASDSTSRGASAVEHLDAAMVAVATANAAEFVQRLDWSGRHRLLDVGCGPAIYTFAVLDAHPRMQATLLDFSGPLATARRLARERGLESRVHFVEADARTFQCDSSFDTVLVSQLLHMLSPQESRDLLTRLRHMLAPGGHVIVHAQFLNDNRVSPHWPVLLNLVEAVLTPAGRNHTLSETAAWLADAGFVNVHHVPFAPWNPSSALVGECPSSPGTV